MRQIVYMVLVLQFTFSALFSQQIIKGRVVSAIDSSGIERATIKMRESKQAVLTDHNGYFTISGMAKSILIISAVGFQAKEIQINPQQKGILHIVLNTDEKSLDEVVINTGYQRIPRERATGSFVQVDQALLNRSTGTNILDRLADVVPGLIFNRNAGSGVRTGGNGISIRGQSTLFARTDPIIVLDNFPYEGDLSSINPNDIESITVLRDAAAASIWGAKAGNGVIVITSKSGKFNQPLNVSFNAVITAGQKPDLFLMPEMSSSDYIDMEKLLFSKGYYNSAAKSTNKTPLTPVVEMLLAVRDGKLEQATADAAIEELKKNDIRTDLGKYYYQQSLKRQYALQLSGGTERQRYLFSAGYDHNRDAQVGNGLKRLTLRLNNNYKLWKDILELNTGINFTNTNLSNNLAINEVKTAVYGQTPYARLADENGQPMEMAKKLRLSYLSSVEALDQGLLDWRYVPLEELKLSDNNAKLTEYQLNTGLRIKLNNSLFANVSYQFISQSRDDSELKSADSYFVRDQVNRLTIVNADGTLTRPVPVGGIRYADLTGMKGHGLRTQLNYSQSWNDNHNLSAIAGYELKTLNTVRTQYQEYGYDEEHATSKIVDYIGTYKLYYNASSNANQIPNVQSISDATDRYLSWYANAAYLFKQKYLFSASARLDRSNIFGVNTNQKGVPLWSAGLGWELSREGFYKSTLLPYLKARLTYGYNGNVDKSLSSLTTAEYNNGRSNSNNSSTGLPYAAIINPPNPELRWERVEILNAAIDFKTSGDRVSGNVEMYFKNGKDLIGSSPLAPSTGKTTFRGNSAQTITRGLDLSLQTINTKGVIRWQTNFFFSLVKDKVKQYLTKSLDQVSNDYVAGSIPLEGKPHYALFTYKWGGLDATGSPQGYLHGQLSKDYSKIISETSIDELVYHGPERPVYFGAFRNSFSWKQISFSFNISYRLGYYIRKPTVHYNDVLSGLQSHGDFALRWQKPGDEQFTNVPALPGAKDAIRDNFYLLSGALVRKGDHVRLQDVTLDYTFKLKAGLGIKSLQVYGYANNLGILWKAAGDVNDPDYQLSFAPSRQISFGLRASL